MIGAPFDAPVLHGPRIGLLDALTVLAEAKQRRAAERDVLAVLAYEGPPLDGGAVAVNQRLTEPRFGPLLLTEGPQDVVARRLGHAERMREKQTVVRIKRDDRLRVERAPAEQPAVDPAPRRRLRVHGARLCKREDVVQLGVEAGAGAAD